MTALRRPTSFLEDPSVLLRDLQKDKDGFQKLSHHLHTTCGIHLPLTDKNLSLMASRLNSILKQYNLNSYGAYHRLISDDELKTVEFVQALTTNTTHFFREAAHYDYLKIAFPKVVDAKKQQGKKQIRVWCAAASTGQEPYSIAMVLLDLLEGAKEFELKFLATDIDLEVLARAARGVYSEAECSKLPTQMRSKYFRQIGSSENLQFQVKQTLGQSIRFAKLNLLDRQYDFQHPFDIIFCRNVLIYFDRETSHKVVNNLADCMSDHGFLFLGHSESGAARESNLKLVSPAVFQKKLPAGRAK